MPFHVLHQNENHNEKAVQIENDHQIVSKIKGEKREKKNDLDFLLVPSVGLDQEVVKSRRGKPCLLVSCSCC